MEIIKQELIKFDEFLSVELLTQGNQISKDIFDFNFSKSKKLRPKLIFLFAKALDKNIVDNIYNLACATELIHNATLIHDDIIDNSDFRRGNLSLNKKFGNNLSVLSGDLLLAIAMRVLAKCNSVKCFEIFANSIKNMCEGEINQHFSLNKVPNLDEYIQKSKKKTAELYIASLTAFGQIIQIEEIEQIKNFAENFGIAFQIKDDLMNILNVDSSKPTNSDILNGIYTAPVIFLKEKIKNFDLLTKSEIISLIKSEDYFLNQTLELIKDYSEKAIASIDFIRDNCFKQEILNLTENLYKVDING